MFNFFHLRPINGEDVGGKFMVSDDNDMQAFDESEFDRAFPVL
jgi:hypothetical protein